MGSCHARGRGGENFWRHHASVFPTTTLARNPPVTMFGYSHRWRCVLIDVRNLISEMRQKQREREREREREEQREKCIEAASCRSLGKTLYRAFPRASARVELNSSRQLFIGINNCDTSRRLSIDATRREQVGSKGDALLVRFRFTSACHFDRI